MFTFLYFVLFFVTSPVAAAAHKPPIKQDQKILEEACLCQDCQPRWYWPWSRPHPLSQAEEEVARAFAALPFATIPGRNGDTRPLLAHMLEYVENDFKGWLPRTTYKNCMYVSFNAPEDEVDYYDAGTPGISTSIWIPGITFTKKYAAFDDGRYWEYQSGPFTADSVETISTCGRHKVSVSRGKLVPRLLGRIMEQTLTVVTHCRIDHLARIKARMNAILQLKDIDA